MGSDRIGCVLHVVVVHRSTGCKIEHLHIDKTIQGVAYNCPKVWCIFVGTVTHGYICILTVDQYMVLMVSMFYSIAYRCSLL